MSQLGHAKHRLDCRRASSVLGLEIDGVKKWGKGLLSCRLYLHAAARKERP